MTEHFSIKFQKEIAFATLVASESLHFVFVFKMLHYFLIWSGEIWNQSLLPQYIHFLLHFVKTTLVGSLEFPPDCPLCD